MITAILVVYIESSIATSIGSQPVMVYQLNCLKTLLGQAFVYLQVIKNCILHKYHNKK